MIIKNMTDEMIEIERNRECECKPALPDGREFPLCIPCKVRQDLQRIEQLAKFVLDLDDCVDDADIDWSDLI